MDCSVKSIKCGFVNAFIISSGSGAVLVDTGMEDCRYDVLREAREAGVRLLVLTHGHIDHVQNAAYISAELGIPVAMSEKDVNILTDPEAQTMTARDIIGKGILQKRGGSIPPFAPSIFLSEGDSLSPYGIDASVIALPGHTDGSIGLDIAGKYLIVGDALMNMMHPSLPHIYHDRGEMMRSAERITEMGGRIILFGHGKSAENRVWVKKQPAK